jgi:hypothetical protein
MKAFASATSKVSVFYGDDIWGDAEAAVASFSQPTANEPTKPPNAPTGVDQGQATPRGGAGQEAGRNGDRPRGGGADQRAARKAVHIDRPADKGSSDISRAFLLHDND